MRYTLFETHKDGLILIARILLLIPFVIFGYDKLTGFSGTVAYMTSEGLPLPAASAALSIVFEFFMGIAILIGFYTRPLALLLAIYTLISAFLAHHYWTIVDSTRMEYMINFYKNVSVVGGLLMFSVMGAGKYSIDGR